MTTILTEASALSHMSSSSAQASMTTQSLAAVDTSSAAASAATPAADGESAMSAVSAPLSTATPPPAHVPYAFALSCAAHFLSVCDITHALRCSRAWHAALSTRHTFFHHTTDGTKKQGLGTRVIFHNPPQLRTAIDALERGRAGVLPLVQCVALIVRAESGVEMLQLMPRLHAYRTLILAGHAYVACAQDISTDSLLPTPPPLSESEAKAEGQARLSALVAATFQSLTSLQSVCLYATAALTSFFATHLSHLPNLRELTMLVHGEWDITTITVPTTLTHIAHCSHLHTFTFSNLCCRQWVNNSNAGVLPKPIAAAVNLPSSCSENDTHGGIQQLAAIANSEMMREVQWMSPLLEGALIDYYTNWKQERAEINSNSSSRRSASNKTTATATVTAAATATDNMQTNGVPVSHAAAAVTTSSAASTTAATSESEPRYNQFPHLSHVILASLEHYDTAAALSLFPALTHLTVLDVRALQWSHPFPTDLAARIHTLDLRMQPAAATVQSVFRTLTAVDWPELRHLYLYSYSAVLSLSLTESLVRVMPLLSTLSLAGFKCDAAALSPFSRLALTCVQRLCAYDGSSKNTLMLASAFPHCVSIDVQQTDVVVRAYAPLLVAMPQLRTYSTGGGQQRDMSSLRTRWKAHQRTLNMKKAADALAAGTNVFAAAIASAAAATATSTAAAADTRKNISALSTGTAQLKVSESAAAASADGAVQSLSPFLPAAAATSSTSSASATLSPALHFRSSAKKGSARSARVASAPSSHTVAANSSSGFSTLAPPFSFSVTAANVTADSSSTGSSSSSSSSSSFAFGSAFTAATTATTTASPSFLFGSSSFSPCASPFSSSASAIFSSPASTTVNESARAIATTVTSSTTSAPFTFATAPTTPSTPFVFAAPSLTTAPAATSPVTSTFHPFSFSSSSSTAASASAAADTVPANPFVNH